jgi:hypothetical protein
LTRPDQSNRRISVGNTQMTRQEILAALEANIDFAKGIAAVLLRYLGNLPPSREQAHVVHELQRIQGCLGGVVRQLVRALRDDDHDWQRPDDPPAC